MWGKIVSGLGIVIALVGSTYAGVIARDLAQLVRSGANVGAATWFGVESAFMVALFAVICGLGVGLMCVRLQATTAWKLVTSFAIIWGILGFAVGIGK